MKLQVAIDLLNTKEMIEISQKLYSVVDIIEVGTPVIMLEGLHAVTALRKSLPNSLILADTKIVDGAKLETQYAINAGANIITVLGVANDKTIEDCIETAHKNGCSVLVDLIGVKDVATRSQEIDEMGADYISVHTASDIQSEKNNPLQDLASISKVVKNSKIACAGGINLSTIHQIMEFKPDVIIIGSAITSNEDPYKVAETYYKLIKEND